MPKTDKELAVELTAVWVQAIATMATNPNVTGASVPSPTDIAHVVNQLTQALSKIGER